MSSDFYEYIPIMIIMLIITVFIYNIADLFTEYDLKKTFLEIKEAQ